MSKLTRSPGDPYKVKQKEVTAVSEKAKKRNVTCKRTSYRTKVLKKHTALVILADARRRSLGMLWILYLDLCQLLALLLSLNSFLCPIPESIISKRMRC